MNRRILATVVPAAIILATLHAPAALAQLTNPGMIQTPGARPGAPSRPEKGARETAPPALPGSRAEPTAVIPADRVAADMPPTEALFDSINRGDLAGSRDAISRGADLQGTNVLGLTPLELSVDLGRNEISFLLLSLRSGGGYSAARVAAAPAETKPPTRAERLAAGQAERARKAQAAARPAVAAAPRAPRLFAGNGGAPIAQSGFLGFDTAR
jgi:hypothetical protein